MLSCVAGTGAFAQTAYFSGAQVTVGSGFSDPVAVAFDSSGNMYVASAGNNTIEELLAVNGVIPASPTIRTLGSGFNSPEAIAVDAGGDVFVGDTGNGAVKEMVAVSGSVPASPTIRTLTSIENPYGVAVDPSGNVYVAGGCPYGNIATACGDVIELLAVNGSIPTQPSEVIFNNSFNNPTGLALDSSGNLYVADQGNNAIKELLAVNGSISLNSTLETLYTFTGTAGPAGVVVDASGNVYVTDIGTSIAYELLAVNGSIPASPTLITLSTALDRPAGIALDASGNIYIADVLNNRVLKVSLSGLSMSGGNFGDVNIGTTFSAIPMVFTFETAGTLGSTAVVTQGATGLDFANAGGGTCVANTAYTAGESCTINVAFTPKFAGIRSGTVELLNTSGNVITAGPVYGVGVGPQVKFLPGVQMTVGSFNEPQGAAIDNNGNVYVSNATSISEIHAVNGVIPASPSVTTLLSTGGAYSSVAVDNNGNVYAAPYPGDSVIEIEAVNGVIPASPTIITLASSFNNPEGLAVDSAGNVYVADSLNQAIKEILAVNGSIPASPTIVTLATAGCSLTSVAVDLSGDVYFAGCNNSLMQIEAVNGAIPASPTVRTLVTNIQSDDLAVDGAGNIYVSNTANNAVQEILAVNGTIPASPGILTLSESFSGPQGVAVDASGNLYVADTLNNRLAKLNFASAPSLAFAPTTIGTVTDSPQSVTFINAGNAPLNFPVLSSGLNPNIPTNFILENSAGSCPVALAGFNDASAIVAGEYCQLSLNFKPTAIGALSNPLVLTDNNLNAAAPAYSSQSIGLSGTGTFALSAQPASLTIVQGGSATVTLTTPGFSGSVNLTLPDPSGLAYEFSPNPATGTGVLTLLANKSLPTGNYSLTIVATSGTQSESVGITVTVVPAPGFTLAASPSSLSVAQGATVTSGITVTGLNGFAGSVSLAASGLPPNVTAAFTPNPTSGTALLTLTAASYASLGTGPITITGTSGTLTASTTLSLTVNPVQVTAPLPVNFGAVNIGTASQPTPLTFVFVNGGTFGSTALFTEGATGLDFTDAGTGTCSPSTVYAVGQSCTINVVFTPTLSGARYGAASVEDIYGDVLATGYVQGTGLGPQVNFLPGTESTIANASGGLVSPNAVAIDGSGNVYIADTGTSFVWEDSPSAGGFNLNTISSSSLNQATAVTVDGNGNVYIADTGNNRVIEETPIASGGTNETIVASAANNGIVSPTGLAVDGSGNVYFFSSGTLYEESPSAGSYTQTTIPTSGLANPVGIAVDGNGNLYIADSVNNQVYEETLSAGSYTQSTIPSSGLNSPGGVAVDGNGNLFIADTANNRVLEEKLSAGSYIQSIVSTSTLNSPLGVALDGSGNVYVVDGGNVRVLKEDLFDAPSLTFATTPVGTASPDSPQTVAIENIGNAALTLPVPSTGNNPNIAAGFTLNSSAPSACPLISPGSSTSGTLAAGASCQLPISFNPTAVGSLSGSLVLTDNNLNAAAPAYTSQTIALSGTATQQTPTINWATPAAITYGTLLSAAQLNATSSVPGAFVYFPAAGSLFSAGPQTLTVTFTPNDTTDYTTATATVVLTVNQATPAITWARPRAIAYGTALSTTQLNAASTVAGTFTYSPAAGTVLNAGTQTLTVTFTPTDTVDYTTASDSVPLMVNKGTLVVTWPTPAAISYGTALSPAQLDATSNAVGTFSYSPAAGAILAVGTHILTVTFTPSYPTDYTTTTATASVTLTVDKASPAITWPTPAAITYGTALGGAQLDASSTVAGTFKYSPGAGAVLAAGSQTLSVVFTPTNTTDYTPATAAVTLTVNQATPTITWQAPKTITYGTALSATQLNASANVSGTFTYSPKSGTVLGAGLQTLTVTFAPTDSTDYTTETVSVSLIVNKATPPITWATPKAIAYGTPLSASQLDASSNVAGSFVYSPGAGTVLTAGSQTLTATFTPTNTADYATAAGAVTLTVNRATPTVNLSASSTSATYGTSITFTATVTGNGTEPTGTVSFLDGTTQIGTGSLNANGVASFSTTKLAVGKHNIAASFAGNGNYLAATSSAISATITK